MMKKKPARYQVVYEADDSPPAEDFRTKKAANDRVKELALKGIKAHVWDTLDNSITNLLKFR